MSNPWRNAYDLNLDPFFSERIQDTDTHQNEMDPMSECTPYSNSLKLCRRDLEPDHYGADIFIFIISHSKQSSFVFISMLIN